MDRVEWEAHRDAPEGPRKRKMLSKLLADNEALARYCVWRFISTSTYYTDNLEADLLQAARIGLMRALPAWDPDKGGFNNVAFNWIWHEMQLVVRHASGISIPKSAFLPRAKQDEIARFEALHGRPPEPVEVGLTPATVERARKACVEMGPIETADEYQQRNHDVDAEDEAVAAIDRKRDQLALQDFLGTLSKKDVKDFWSGARADLTAKAKAYVEGARTGNVGK